MAHLAAAPQAAGGGAQAQAQPPRATARAERDGALGRVIDGLPGASSSGGTGEGGSTAGALVRFSPSPREPPPAPGARGAAPFSASLSRRMATNWPRPEWHAPWKLYRVVSGHLGWVRSISVEPGNEWFATGSADRTIKIWDLASGSLKLTLTGHIEQVMGLAVSDRHPYMFSAGLDKMVKCWDLEYNKVIRHYHGHLSGIYALALHPGLDVLMTGGRDSSCRVWDMRTKAQVCVIFPFLKSLLTSVRRCSACRGTTTPCVRSSRSPRTHR